MESRRGAASHKTELTDFAGGSGGDVEPWAKETSVVHWELGTEQVLKIFSPNFFFFPH